MNDLNQASKAQIREYTETLFSRAPEILGIDEAIAGCEVLDLDPYAAGAGTFPRYIKARLRGGTATAGGYAHDIYWRGTPLLAVGDYITVLHLRDGNRYEILGMGGGGGTSGAVPLPVARGDIITAQTATPTWAVLPKGTQFQVLTGGVNEPTWGAVTLNQATAVTGTLPVANGGTGIATTTAYGVICGGTAATNPFQNAGAGAAGQVLVSNGAAALPSWSSTLDANARVCVRKNSGADVGTRRRLNLIEGANVTLTIADDAGSEEVDITIACGGGAGAHNILSATHTDTVAAAVVRGDLMVGDVTPNWARFALAGAVGSVLTRTATDPTWSGYYLSGTAAQTYTFPATTCTLAGLSIAQTFTAVQKVNIGSATAFIVEQTGVKNNVLVVDTVNARVGVWMAAPTGQFNIGYIIDTAPLAYINGGNEGLVINATRDVVGASFLGTVDFVAGRASDAGAGGSQFRFITQPRSVGAPVVSMLINRNSNVGIYEALPTARLHLCHTTTANNSDSYGIKIKASDATVLLLGVDTSAGYIQAMQDYISWSNRPLVLQSQGGDVGVGTMPDRRLHSEVANTVTAAISYPLRLSHATSGTAAALFGAGMEFELEHSSGAMQVASELTTLWAVAVDGTMSPLFRGTVNPGDTAGPGYWGYWTGTVSDAARMAIPDGVGDVTKGLSFLFVVAETVGGGSGQGTGACANNAQVDLYNDGVDILRLAIPPEGYAYLTRPAGNETFKVSLLMNWL